MYLPTWTTAFLNYFMINLYRHNLGVNMTLSPLILILSFFKLNSIKQNPKSVRCAYKFLIIK